MARRKSLKERRTLAFVCGCRITKEEPSGKIHAAHTCEAHGPEVGGSLSERASNMLRNAVSVEMHLEYEYSEEMVDK